MYQCLGVGVVEGVVKCIVDLVGDIQCVGFGDVGNEDGFVFYVWGQFDQVFVCVVDRDLVFGEFGLGQCEFGCYFGVQIFGDIGYIVKGLDVVMIDLVLQLFCVYFGFFFVYIDLDCCFV